MRRDGPVSNRARRPASLGARDQVLCSGTLGRGPSFRDRVAAATAGGFTGISLWGRDYQAALDEGLRATDIRLLLADHGLSVAELRRTRCSRG